MKMELGEPDSSGRRRPIPIKGSEFIIPADTMIAAVAQAPEISFLDQSHGLEITPKGTFAIDPLTLATSAWYLCRGRCSQRALDIDPGYCRW